MTTDYTEGALHQTRYKRIIPHYFKYSWTDLNGQVRYSHHPPADWEMVKNLRYLLRDRIDENVST